MIDEIKEILRLITPDNYPIYAQELFFLIIKNNLALSEIEEIQNYVKEYI